MKKRGYIYLLPTVLWIVFLFFLNIVYSTHIINSDMSAELVLSRELSRTNRIFSFQWYYSTEVRILYTQIVALIFFKFIKSWTLVRALTNLVFYVLLLVTYIYALKPLKLSERSVYLSSLFLFIPYSAEYLGIVHIGNSYIPHFVVILFCIGLILRLQDTFNKISFAMLIIISFYAGLCGIRYVAALALPVIVCAIFKIVLENALLHTEYDKNIFKDLNILIPLVCFISCIVGYICNATILTRFVSVGHNNDLLLNVLDDTGVIGMADTLIMGILRLFGYYDFAKLGSLHGIASITAIFMFITLIIIVATLLCDFKNLSDKCRFMLLTFVSSMLINTFIFMFLAGSYVPRFYMPSLIFIAPMIAIYIDSTQRMKIYFHSLVALVLVASMNISGIVSCFYCIDKDLNAPCKELVSFLSDNDLNFGLTPFWNTGVINELSDGRIECVNIIDSDITRFHGWLTFKKYEHIATWENLAVSQIFLLLNEDIYINFKDTKMVSNGELVYDWDGYKVLVYDKDFFVNNYAHQYTID